MEEEKWEDFGETVEAKPEEAKEGESLIVGVVPALNKLFLDAAWNVIRPAVEKITNMSMGEYKLEQVYWKIFYGNAFLYMAYFDSIDPKTTEQAYIAVKLGSRPEETKKKCIGYFILQPVDSGCLIWQAFILRAYQNEDTLRLGVEKIKAEAKRIGAPYLSFYSTREGWGRLAPKIGFTETFTTFRMQI